MPEDNASVQRALGKLCEAVEGQTRGIERLLDNFANHVASDERRLGAIEVALARREGERDSGERRATGWRRFVHGMLGPTAGGIIGAVVTHFIGWRAS
jgi:hypothetical protein